MCGIYGIVERSRAVDMRMVEARRDLMRHRGPDDGGLWLAPQGDVGLAHRRLSIIDLSPAGHQPMSSADKRYTIVFNGEIYNFAELRIELEKAGFVFKGQSDTEVVLAAYQAWGERCLQRFNGMFALAIYDAGDASSPRSLFLARDRVGKKPLYYALESGRFQFASELKSIAASGGIDPQALNHYLALGYVPHHLCIRQGVLKLPPAHAARLNLDSFAFQSWRYWFLPENRPAPDAKGEALADQAESILLDAVRLRMVSDVPLGVLLSGGLDSSLVAAAAARQSGSAIKAFTISFPNTRFDEASYARCVADYLGAEHHILPIERPSLDLLEDFRRLIDEPIADSSILPTFLVSRLTRQHVTVALGGDGGDELFGGYSDYPISLADQRRLGWLPQPLLRMAAQLAATLPAGIRGRNRLASLRGGPLHQMIWGSPYFDIELRKRILHPDMRAQLAGEIDAPERWLLSLFMQGHDAVDCMTRMHFGSVLPDDFLVKVDRASMMNSLEMRCPLLDYRLIEFAFGQIPSHWKVRDGETRRVQRILGERWLPKNLDTNRKQGFSIPLDDWMRASSTEMFEMMNTSFSGMLREEEILGLVQGLRKGRANGARLFALLMLDITNRNLFSE